MVSADTLTQRHAPNKIHTAASGEKRVGVFCFSGLRMTLTLCGRSVASVFIHRNTPRNLLYLAGFPWSWRSWRFLRLYIQPLLNCRILCAKYTVSHALF